MGGIIQAVGVVLVVLAVASCRIFADKSGSPKLADKAVLLILRFEPELIAGASQNQSPNLCRDSTGCLRGFAGLSRMCRIWVHNGSSQILDPLFFEMPPAGHATN